MELTLPRNKDIQKIPAEVYIFILLSEFFFVVEVLNLLLC